MAGGIPPAFVCSHYNPLQSSTLFMIRIFRVFALHSFNMVCSFFAKWQGKTKQDLQESLFHFADRRPGSNREQTFLGILSHF